MAKVLDTRSCEICRNEFEPKQWGQKLCGDFSCKMKRNRLNSLMRMRESRKERREETLPCEACGFWLSERHREDDKQFQLCPNCRASITRGYYSVEEVISGENKKTPF